MLICCAQDFKRLPDAQKVKFVEVPAVDLQHLLPNLPTDETQADRYDCLDLLSKMLVYPPESRLRAQAALAHPLFSRGLPLLLPPGYLVDTRTVETQFERRSLPEILARLLPGAN